MSSRSDIRRRLIRDIRRELRALGCGEQLRAMDTARRAERLRLRQAEQALRDVAALARTH